MPSTLVQNKNNSRSARVRINREFNALIASKNEAALLDFIKRHPEKSSDGITAIVKWRGERHFVVYENAILGGVLAGQTRANSIIQCQRACTGECTGYTFITAERICKLWTTVSGRLPRGGHKSGALAEVPLGQFNTTRQPAPSAAASTRYRRFRNIDLINPENSPLDYSILLYTSFRACEAICRQDQRCIAYTHNGNLDSCVLKSGYSSGRSFTNARSGIKR